MGEWAVSGSKGKLSSKCHMNITQQFISKAYELQLLLCGELS